MINNKSTEEQHQNTNNKKNQEKCQSLLGISDKIRYAGILNKYGRTLAGKLRGDIKPLLNPEQARDERFIEAMRNHLRNSFESAIGKSLYTITKNEKVILILISSKTQDTYYYLTVEKDVKLNEIEEILNEIEEIEDQK